MCMCFYVSKCVRISIYVWIGVLVHACALCVCVCVRVGVCVCVCVYECVCVCDGYTSVYECIILSLWFACMYVFYEDVCLLAWGHIMWVCVCLLEWIIMQVDILLYARDACQQSFSSKLHIYCDHPPSLSQSTQWLQPAIFDTKALCYIFEYFFNIKLVSHWTLRVSTLSGDEQYKVNTSL